MCKVHITLNKSQNEKLSELVKNNSSDEDSFLQDLIEAEYDRHAVVAPFIFCKVTRSTVERHVNFKISEAHELMLNELVARYKVAKATLIRKLIEEEYFMSKYQNMEAV